MTVVGHGEKVGFRLIAERVVDLVCQAAELFDVTGLVPTACDRTHLLPPACV